MTPEHWDRVKQLYDVASKLAPVEQAAFLADACAQNEELRHDVQMLLDQPVGTASFVDFVGGPPPLPSPGRDDNRSLIGSTIGP